MVVFSLYYFMDRLLRVRENCLSKPLLKVNRNYLNVFLYNLISILLYILYYMVLGRVCRDDTLPKIILQYTVDHTQWVVVVAEEDSIYHGRTTVRNG